MERGRGIGIEVGPTRARAVVVAESGGTILADVAVDRGDGDESALVRLGAQLPSGCAGAPARLAWDGPEIDIETTDVTGAGPAQLGALVRRLASSGAAAVTTTDRDGRRLAVSVRWDQGSARRLVAAATAAGFRVEACEPAELARDRTAERDAARGAALAAAGVVAARRLHPFDTSAGAPATAQPWVVERLPDAPVPPARRPPWWARLGPSRRRRHR